MGDITGLVTPIGGGSGGSGILFQWGVPVIVPSSCTMGANGAFTAMTALPTTFGNCYLVLPAGYVTAAQAAGVYYAQFSSTTAGTIFNNPLASGLPSIIASPTPFVAAAGTGTQISTVQAALTLALPAGYGGANGCLRIKSAMLAPNNADTRSLALTLGGTQCAIFSTVSNLWYGISRTIRNVASQAVQVAFNTGVGSAGSDEFYSASGQTFFAVNTAVTQNLVFNATIGTVTDFLIILGGTVEAVFAA